ncbi:MAG: DUF4325 domain-containing protein, partial [Sulfobacillus thermotolerans]|nr:DUF4325 domain-containing protein [Sulfobacillus thermotolerans]
MRAHDLAALRLPSLLVDHCQRQKRVALDVRQIDVMASTFADDCFGTVWDTFDHETIRRTIFLTLPRQQHGRSIRDPPSIPEPQ